MALIIRLRRQGRTNRPFYRLVLTDERQPRDGGYQEALGWYNPFEAREELAQMIQTDRVGHWLGQGVLLSDNAKRLIGKLAPQLIDALRQKAESKRRKKNEKAKTRRRTGGRTAAKALAR